MKEAERYASEHMEKIFYFCLKKTGNENDASELASDIGFEILSALHRGAEPKNFEAWMWQIARNRWARWAHRKWYSDEPRCTDMESGGNAIAAPDDVESDIVESEELTLLKRELAFVRSDYRRILVAHYFEEKSVSVISRELGIPPGTVKTRLVNGRKRLKEGMDMARTFGKRSYAPEEISFINNGMSGEKGQPWSILTHLMYKNIFLELFDSPKSADELSMELGIALPYMESELEFLTNETFLVRKGELYETSFPIVGSELQRRVFKSKAESSKRAAVLIEKLLDGFDAACGKRGINYFGNYVDRETAKWTLFVETIDFLGVDKSIECTDRPDGGKWDIVGFENTELDRVDFVGKHGYGKRLPDEPEVYFQQFKFQYKELYDRTPQFISYRDAAAIEAIARCSHADVPQSVLDDLEKYEYIRREGEGYVPNIVVFNREADRLDAFGDGERAELKGLSAEIRGIFADHAEYVRTAVEAELPATIRKDEKMSAAVCSALSFNIRGFAVGQALEDGWLKYDETLPASVGAYIAI